MLTAIKTRIETNRFDETLGFYAGILGLRMVHEWKDGADAGAILGLSDADADGFLEIASVPETNELTGVCLQFRTDNLDAFLESLPGNCEFSRQEVKPWGSTYVYFRDPNGNRVIVFEGAV